MGSYGVETISFPPVFCNDVNSPLGDSPNEDISPEEIAKQKQEETAKHQRKKAGLPELELDALPSSMAQKMAILSMKFDIDLSLNKNVLTVSFHNVMELVRSQPPTKNPFSLRTCLTKRQAKLQLVLDKFTAASQLSELQTRNLSYNKCGYLLPTVFSSPSFQPARLLLGNQDEDKNGVCGCQPWWQSRFHPAYLW